MVRQTAVVIVLEILGGLILLALVLAGLLLLRLSSGPIDLGVFRADVEEAIAEARGGRPVSVGSLQLEWSPEGRRVQIAAQNVRLMDAAGQPAAEAAKADIQLSGSALLFGDIEVLSMALSDGWIAFDQISAMQWAIAGDPLPPFRETVLPDTPQGWIDYAGRVLPEWMRALREAQQGARFEVASFDNFEMRVRNSDRQMIATIEQASGSLINRPEGVALSFSGGGLGEGLPGRITLLMETAGEDRRMRTELEVIYWPLGDFAARLGLDGELTEGLLADIRLAADISEATGLDQLMLTAEAGAGQLSFADAVWPVRDLDIALRYERAADRLNVKVASREAGPFRGAADITMDEALTGEGFRPFELTSPALTLDLTPAFEGPLDLASVRLAGEVDMDTLALRAAAADFVSGAARFRAQGDLARTPDRAEGEPPVLGKLDFSVGGPFPVETVYAFWPMELGAGARRFAAQRIPTGAVNEVKGTLTLERDSLAGGNLRDDHLDLSFTAEDVRVQFLDDLPPVENASGEGHLTGNSFRVLAKEGSFGGWTVQEGFVHFPAFNPRGEPFRVFARGRGPAERMMKALVESRLDIDIDPARVSGDGELTFEMFRPALNDVPYEDVRFTAVGLIRNAGLKDAALGFDLSSGSVNVNVDQTGATLSGDGRLGPSPVNFRWRQGFLGEDTLADLLATGSVSADFLNRFGILGRAYMTGEAPIDVTAQLRGATLLTSSVTADLTSARLDMSEIGWVKPAGDKAAAEVDYVLRDGRSTSRVMFTSPTARLDGDFTLDASSRLVAAQLREAFFRNVAEVAGSVSRGSDDRISITLSGKYLDVSGLMPGLGGVAAAAGPDAEEGTPLMVAASVDRLTLRPGLDLRQAKLLVNTGTKGLLNMQASGLGPGGAPLEAALDAEGDGPARLSVSAADAGFLASAFLGADFITGGQLELTGTLEAPNRPAELLLLVTNARMKDAPFLTQILSLASLRGLADTLGGEGVMFSRMDIPMKVSGGRYVIEGAKAQGPALGLTASGYVDMAGKDIEFDGVLVPSFGINSALGGIPIIGDLVVGRDGEGVFSLTYSVRGTLDKANVAVNPLSALAPGVIRRIFENPSDVRIPEAKPRPPDQPMPAELPPIKEETF
ncbi:MAG: AsmA-like C-terminal domain-containing protein [Hyphomonas sp.]